jgi:hypothetical protein
MLLVVGTLAVLAACGGDSGGSDTSAVPVFDVSAEAVTDSDTLIVVHEYTCEEDDVSACTTIGG